MLRSYFLINLILLAIIGILGFNFYKVLMRPLDIPSKVTQQKSQTVKKDTIDKKELSLDEGAYNIVVQKDLFRPTRSAPPIKETIGQIFKEPPKLYGTVIMGNEKSAILEDPSTKTTRLYHINDSIVGFIISDIQKDRVILLRDTEKIEVQLREMKVLRPSGPSAPIPRPSRRMPPPPSPQRPLPPTETTPPMRPAEPPPPPEEGFLPPPPE